MSHNIHYTDYKEDVNKQKVQNSLDEYVRHEDWGEGASGTPNPIRWVDRVYESYEEAQKAIEREDARTWYNCMAVKYKSYMRPAKSKAVTEIEQRIEEQRQAVAKLIKDSSIQNRKSEYIGCPKCGSSLKRTLLRGECCPLCHEDLRSATNLSRIENARKKLDELSKKKEEAVRKSTKPEIRWLVKIEYHT